MKSEKINLAAPFLKTDRVSTVRIVPSSSAAAQNDSRGYAGSNNRSSTANPQPFLAAAFLGQRLQGFGGERQSNKKRRRLFNRTGIVVWLHFPQIKTKTHAKIPQGGTKLPQSFFFGFSLRSLSGFASLRESF
ncbi:hypothetical protein L0337_21185 [candidate division KSB1 bacterium]|nr:hypothetical protein [candidate division KSB1 bacterium]